MGDDDDDDDDSFSTRTAQQQQRTTATAAAASRRRLLLVFCDGVVTEHVLPDSGTVILGRQRDSADIVINHQTVSKKHVKLTLGAHVTVEDCGSRNGTTMSGRRLLAHEIVFALPGSPIEIGDVLIIFRASGTPADFLAADSSVQHQRQGPVSHESLDRIVARIAATDINVLIAGEAGVGKTYLANRIHQLSSYRNTPIVRFATSAGKDGDDDHELVRGDPKRTLVVDSISTLSIDRQRLLATIARGKHARVIALSTVELQPIVTRGAFSQDLVHALSALEIVVPPLRARLRELPLIAQSLLEEIAREHSTSTSLTPPPPLLSADALAALSRHTWSGNVRELRQVLTRATMLGSRRVLTAAHFDLGGQKQAAGSGTGTLSSAVSEAEHLRILEALRHANGNQTRAAKMLGISRGTLITRLERYAVPRPRK